MLNNCPRDKYDPDHPTCRSCVQATGPCSKGRRKKVKSDVPVNTWHKKDQLFTTLFVHGLNRWTNKHRSNYMAVKRDWEKVLAGTVFLWGKADGKRRLELTRIVTSRAHLIKDADNLEGCLKPVKDVLTRQGVLLDDSMDLVETHITQTVGKQQLAIIQISTFKEDTSWNSKP